MLVEEVMTRPVVSAERDWPLGRALDVMRESGHRRLPVVEEGRLVGLLSRGAAEGGDAALAVEEAMRREVIACAPETAAEEAAVRLLAHRIGALPVVDDGALAGIVTRADLLGALLGPASQPEPLAEPADAAVAEAVRIANWMRGHDRFAGGMGIRLEAVEPGYCRASLTVTAAMLNAVGTAHGGATFTLADFVFAVASNSHGQASVGLSTTMNYPAASREGERLIAEAREVSRGGRTGLYTVRITKEDGTLVGLFTGTVYVLKSALSEFMDGAGG